MAQDMKHLQNEVDIGSGEKTAAQKYLEKEQQQLKGSKATEPLKHGAGDKGENSPSGRMLQSGNHLARILAVAQSDHTFEAQVYVRLTREPEIAETYIPAGTFPTEQEAWTAAEERARRAFEENEF